MTVIFHPSADAITRFKGFGVLTPDSPFSPSTIRLSRLPLQQCKQHCGTAKVKPVNYRPYISTATAIFMFKLAFNSILQNNAHRSRIIVQRHRPGSKPSCSTNHFHPRLPSLFRTDSMVSCPAPFLLSISVCFLDFHFTGFSFWFCAVD